MPIIALLKTRQVGGITPMPDVTIAFVGGSGMDDEDIECTLTSPPSGYFIRLYQREGIGAFALVSTKADPSTTFINGVDFSFLNLPTVNQFYVELLDSMAVVVATSNTISKGA